MMTITTTFPAGASMTLIGLALGVFPALVRSGPQDPSSASAPMYTNNVVIILDASGSMAKPMPGTRTVKMAAAKSALKEVLAQIPSGTHVGLAAFGRGAKDAWVYPLGPRDDDKLASAIDSLRPGGGTPLGLFIKLGADRLLEARKAQLGYGTYRLLIVTDGEASDRKLVERYTPQVLARGVTIDVIGVAMKSEHTLARTVHSYRRADDPAALKQAVAEVFAEVGGSDSGPAGSEAFEALAPLPGEVASAMIAAVVEVDNRPIGSWVQQPGSSGDQKPSGDKSATPASPRGSSKPPPETVSDGKSNWFRYVIILVVLMVVGGKMGRRRLQRRRN